MALLHTLDWLRIVTVACMCAAQSLLELLIRKFCDCGVVCLDPSFLQAASAARVYVGFKSDPRIIIVYCSITRL
jgi:hypothetical protein